MPKRASTSAEPSEAPPGAFERFEAFLTKLVRVPKRKQEVNAVNRELDRRT